ncbi:hypothetical protein W97_04590 [Coniosporium apollinis CBS 100218]|uniref:Uncharacterized protein n=1 Tax=Coniosporium apollinis (strain CBS 100218) TaxID=1168221 RepID=R7YTV2_CONA1|nr:uncharacterized protein W97_04590 [Coniosporium apollinis CBS 100218]EON65352.1 hypothetical protein W97_04590 [Coniosporium apollinis CBS 100218]
MLSIDSTEVSNRMGVELELVQREVDVLQQAEERRRGSIMASAHRGFEQAVSQANAETLNELSRHCQSLQNDNEELRATLDQSQKVAERREGEIAKLVEENERLRGRIKKNREHVNGLIEHMQHKSPPQSTFTTPHQTPRRGGNFCSGDPGSSGNRRQQPFEALLLADKMLSQEAATAPSTPSRPPMKQRLGHAQALHPSPSVLSTPSRVRPFNANRVPPRTPPAFSAVQAPSTAPPALHPPRLIRRDSSDSTITASSAEGEGAGAHVDREEVTESQATRSATDLLRRSMNSRPSSFEKAAQASASAGALQSKLFGHVRKPGVSRPGEHAKRGRSPGELVSEMSPTKKGRSGGGMGVGLGIGGLGSPEA